MLRTGSVAGGRSSSVDRDAARGFLRLERRLNAQRELYVPLTEPDARKRLTGRSALSETMTFELFSEDDQACCAAFVNERYQRHHREPVGFIGHFAAAASADRRLVNRMLGRGEAWLSDRGVTRVIAPYDGSFLAGFGLRTGGFEESPMFPHQWHPPFYADLLEAGGYRATLPWWSYRIEFSSETYRLASRRAIEHARCVVRPVNKRRWRDELAALTDIFNETFRDEWEYHPVTTEDAVEFFGPLKAVIDPEQLLFAEVDGQVVGFCLGMPDWNPLARGLNGRGDLVAQVRFALRAKRFAHAGLYAIGVAPSHRGKHIGQTLASTLYRRYESLGLEAAEYSPVNDSNLASRTLATSLGGEGRILYHNFEKVLR